MVEKMSVFFAEQKPQLVFLMPAQLKLLSVVQDHAMVTVKPWLDFADALQVYDRGPMNAHELVRIKLCFHVTHVGADQM